MANAGDMNPWLYTLPPEMWERAKDMKGLTANFLPLAASGTLVVPTTVGTDAHFCITGAVMVVTDVLDQSRLTFAPMLVQISDQTSGTQFYDAPTHVENVFGTGQSPASWAYRKLVLAGNTITTELRNLEATARNVRVLYLGFKIAAR